MFLSYFCMSLAVCFCTSLKCMLRFLFYYPLLSYTVYPPFIVNLPSFILTPITPPLFRSALLLWFGYECPFAIYPPSIYTSIQCRAVHSREGEKERGFMFCLHSVTLRLPHCVYFSNRVITTLQGLNEAAINHQPELCICVCVFD